MIEHISQPSDIRQFSADELTVLAKEIRDTIITTVSENGGHLASNLGMVEATIALHKVFCSPEDKIVFDVGHQCYTHKLLTGRYDDFATLRQFGGISGFTNRDESVHDTFCEGHSGTSVSAALGVATANKLLGKEDYAIAVVGDGSLTNGMIYEALNNCSDKNLNFIILINDNEMSISQNVGGLHNYLTRLRTSKSYYKFKRRLEHTLSKIPLIGKGLARLFKSIKDFVKRIFVNDTIFEDLGLLYFGPVDGHDIEKLTTVLSEAKSKHTACVVHMITRKGKGFEIAEQEPDKYHSTGSFDLQTGKGNETSSKTYSEIFGETLCEIAAEDNKICAITAAMCDGTGLSEFSQRYPDRFFDVGIAEEHAITFAGGLSALGMKPVVALYSTFSQRVYDQILHDISIQNLPLILALDRCGLVPNDGITHQGIFDFSLFSSVPNTEIFSPINGDELASVLKDTAERYDKLSVVRYPKGSSLQAIPQIDMVTDGFISYSSDVRSADVVIVAAGRLFYNALAVRDLLKTEYSVGIIRPIRVYPLDYEAFSNLLGDCRLVYILDENYREGGFGEKLAANLNTKARISVRAVEGFVEHGSLADLMRYCGFDPEQIAEGIQRNLQ